jgi:NADPH:quinone reductase-like Zn-dependent oxidoreductase
MKAAVIGQFGDVPQYSDFPDPIPNDGDVEIDVKAVVLENFDKATAAGKHYASAHMFPQFPAIVGHGGVGTLADGTLVAFGGTKPPYGTMAEQAVVPEMYKAYLTTVPAGVDAGVAAALPSAALSSFLPMKWVGKLQAGETVLINGATGVSGKLAVQIAKLLGAGRIIGTGRSEEGLRAITKLGADAVIDLQKSDDEITEAFVKEAGKGYDVVLDFIWGHPTELFLRTLVPKAAGFATHKTRFVQIGESAGATISLPAEVLRTSGLEISGAGNIPPEVVPEAVKQIWTWIAENQLSIDIETVAMKDIAGAWNRETNGKRIVIIP